MSYFGSYAGSFFGDYFGSIAAATNAIANVYATTTHTVRVVLEAPPLAQDPFATGDALNPETWGIVRNDPETLTIVLVNKVDTVTLDLITLEPIGSHLDTLEVSVNGLLSLGGAPFGDIASASCPGVVQTLDPVDAVTSEVFRDRDLKNPPFDTGRVGGRAGTIQIGSDGDYETEAGRPLLRKLVLRRLGTRRGAFRHLPNYGIGLVEKEPLPSGGDLRLIKKDIEIQVLSEPDVKNCRASLLLDRANVLVVQLFLQDKHGMTLSMRLGSAGGALVEL